MTRRLKRLRDFEISLQIKNDNFIRPPRDAQRNWLLNNAMNEFAQNLQRLNEQAATFVPGAGELASGDRTQALLTDEEIMEDWQLPLMEAMADIVTQGHGHVLEIGFGRGVSAEMIQARGVSAHTIIECNDSVVARYNAWRTRHAQSDIRLAHGLWQDVLGELGQFDGIFFHTYPLNETDFIEQIGQSTTFADHFFEHAAAHLVDGGIFTYLSNEMDSLGRGHQRRLFEHFRSIEMHIVKDLAIPPDVRDAWWSPSMVAVKAVK